MQAIDSVRRPRTIARSVVVACVLWGCDKRADPVPMPPPARGGAATSGRDTVSSGDEGTPVSVDSAGDSAYSGSTERIAAVAADDPLFDRLEGTGLRNACAGDDECFAGGCSGEVCAADPEAVTDCSVAVRQLANGAACGCVASECRWYQTLATPMSGEGVEPMPVPSDTIDPPEDELEACGGEICKPGYTCVEYFGIAGPRGPRFHSCEIPCKRGDASGCPASQSCVTIADGPGSVCR